MPQQLDVLIVRRAAALAAIGAALAGTAAAASDDGAPPKRATIAPNRSMAEVEIGQFARLTGGGTRMEGKAVRDWGVVHLRRCLFREECIWEVPGGGVAEVTIDRDRHRVIYLATTSGRWRTEEGPGVGSTHRAVKRAYPDVVRGEGCIPGHGEGGGLYLPAGGRTTLFQLSHRTGKVAAVRLYTQSFDDLQVPC